jgi:hypothetical protein
LTEFAVSSNTCNVRPNGSNPIWTLTPLNLSLRRADLFALIALFAQTNTENRPTGN